MSFDLLTMLAHAATEVNNQNHGEEAAHEGTLGDSSTTSPPSSTSVGSESTIHFSPRLQAKRERFEGSASLLDSQRGQLLSKPAAPEVDDAAGSAPSSPRTGCTEYECGYCGERKVSTSTGGDGRVRIRCECGGKHGDQKARMHAKWTLVEPGVGGPIKQTQAQSRRSKRRYQPFPEANVGETQH